MGLMVCAHCRTLKVMGLMVCAHCRTLKVMGLMVCAHCRTLKVMGLMVCARSWKDCRPSATNTERRRIVASSGPASETFWTALRVESWQSNESESVDIGLLLRHDVFCQFSVCCDRASVHECSGVLEWIHLLSWMALSRDHTCAKATRPTKLLLWSKCR